MCCGASAAPQHARPSPQGTPALRTTPQRPALGAQCFTPCLLPLRAPCVQELAELAQRCGFDVVESSYATVLNSNRKLSLHLKRVFVHAVLKKRAEDG